MNGRTRRRSTSDGRERLVLVTGRLVETMLYARPLHDSLVRLVASAGARLIAVVASVRPCRASRADR
jgi:hypothetical protein